MKLPEIIRCPDCVGGPPLAGMRYSRLQKRRQSNQGGSMTTPTTPGIDRLTLTRRGQADKECAAYFNPGTSHWLDPENMTRGNIGWANRITPPGDSDEWTITACIYAR